ncbi:hypothetical protein, partial [Mesorhizobium sp. A623]
RRRNNPIHLSQAARQTVSAGGSTSLCIPARLYLFSDKVRGVGEGLLYRGVEFEGFKVFPLIGEGEMEFSTRPNALRGTSYPIFEGLSEIVNNVSHDRAEIFWDWLFGPVGQVKTIRLSQKKVAAGGSIGHLIEVVGHDGRVADQRINMAIGPFNL